MPSRHLARSIAIQSLYEWDFYDKKGNIEEITKRNIEEFGNALKDEIFIFELINGIMTHLEEIDKTIEEIASQWPLEQISIVDRNILRLGIFELLWSDKKAVPPKVAINEAIELAKNFHSLGFSILATEGTSHYLREHGIPSEMVLKLQEGRPNIIDKIKNKEIQLIINTPYGTSSKWDDSYIRKAAIKFKIPYITTIAAAKAAVKGIEMRKKHGEEKPKSLQEYNTQL